MFKKVLFILGILLHLSVSAQDLKEIKLAEPSDFGKVYGTYLKTENVKTAVLIIPGSGPTDRDGNSMLMGKNNSLKYLAEALADEGISSIRVDKRGVNESDRTEEAMSKMIFELFIADAITWINYLENKGYSDIYLAGHSQGSLVSIIAAKASKKVKGVISIAGAARNIDEIILDQLKIQAPDLVPEAEIAFGKMKNGEPINNTNPMLASIFNEKSKSFLASWLRFTPSDEIKGLNVPILIIQGTSDLQVSVKEAETLDMLAKNSKLVKIEKMNHVLKIVQDNDENMKSYSDPEMPLAPELMASIKTWMKI